MKEDKDQIDDLIVARLSGNSSAGEDEQLFQWISASEENKRYYLEQREIWFSSGYAMESFDEVRGFEDFIYRSHIGEEAPETETFREKVMKVFWRGISAAAVVAVCVFTGYKVGELRMNDNFAEIVVEAPVGSRTSVTLPDSTRVWLNAGSTLAYSQGFGIDRRVVRLDGEGYFEVAHDKNKPFKVESKDMCVTVLGTRFNLRNFADDGEVVVTLSEGSVAIDNLIAKNSRRQTLVPGQRAVVDKRNGRMKIEETDASNAHQWIYGYLFFDEELLPDIAKRLERSYNISIVIANEELMYTRFYGNFIRENQSVEDVISNIASTGNMKYKIEGNQITLY